MLRSDCRRLAATAASIAAQLTSRYPQFVSAPEPGGVGGEPSNAYCESPNTRHSNRDRLRTRAKLFSGMHPSRDNGTVQSSSAADIIARVISA